MKINKKTALKLWEERYGSRELVDDFHGYLMCKEGYGDENYYIVRWGKKIYCGWNIHHILPTSCGGTNAKDNLLCTNIATNDAADDKITYWIDDKLYQVKKDHDEGGYCICRLR